MIRTLSMMSLLLASGIAVAAQPGDTQGADGAIKVDDRPTLTVFGEPRSGGNAFNPVYTYQPIQKRIVVRSKKPEAKTAPEPTPAQNEGSGEVQEL